MGAGGEGVGTGCVWTGGWTDRQKSSLAVLFTSAKREKFFFFFLVFSKHLYHNGSLGILLSVNDKQLYCLLYLSPVA